MLKSDVLPFCSVPSAKKCRCLQSAGGIRTVGWRGLFARMLCGVWAMGISGATAWLVNREEEE